MIRSEVPLETGEAVKNSIRIHGSSKRPSAAVATIEPHLPLPLPIGNSPIIRMSTGQMMKHSILIMNFPGSSFPLTIIPCHGWPLAHTRPSHIRITRLAPEIEVSVIQKPLSRTADITGSL